MQLSSDSILCLTDYVYHWESVCQTFPRTFAGLSAGLSPPDFQVLDFRVAGLSSAGLSSAGLSAITNRPDFQQKKKDSCRLARMYRCRCVDDASSASSKWFGHSVRLSEYNINILRSLSPSSTCLIWMKAMVNWTTMKKQTKGMLLQPLNTN